MTSKRILVTGATGYIGSVVSEALAKAGHTVVGLARSDEARRKLQAAGHEAVVGDVGDAQVVVEAARGADAVLHLANTNDARAAEADAAFRAAALGALEGTDKPFVYTSGVWSLGHTGEGVADERSSTLHPLPLVAWRGAAEAEVVAAAAKGVRAIVMRPAIVYGRAGGIPSMLVGEARRDGLVRTVGDGTNEWPVVHLDDLADLYVRALDAPAGSVLHAAATPTYRVRDLALVAAIAGGAPGRVEAWPLEDARKALGGFADALALHQRVSSERTQRLLGWRPKGPSIVEELLTGSYARP